VIRDGPFEPLVVIGFVDAGGFLDVLHPASMPCEESRSMFFARTSCDLAFLTRTFTAFNSSRWRLNSSFSRCRATRATLSSGAEFDHARISLRISKVTSLMSRP